MRYVIDSSVAAKWELLEIGSVKARQFREDVRNDVHSLVAPDIYSIEVAHALTRAERQGRISAGQAEMLWADVMTTPPIFARSSILLPRAIALSSAMRIGVYDCLYVALAERRKCKLVTADDRLVNRLQPQFPFIVSLASLPGASAPPP